MESVKHYKSLCRRVLEQAEGIVSAASASSSFGTFPIVSPMSSSVASQNGHSLEDEDTVSSGSSSNFDFHEVNEDEGNPNVSDSSLGIMIEDNHTKFQLNAEKEKQIEKYAQSIIETYIADQAHKELNLAYGTKEKVLKAFKKTFSNSGQGRDYNEMELVFKPIELYVHNLLKQNHFQNFIRSEAFIEYLTKKGKTMNMLHEIGTLKEGVCYLKVETMADLNKENFTLSDFAFLKQKVFCGESVNAKEWTLAVRDKKDRYRCYFTKDTYDFGTSVGLKFFKFEILFPYKVEDVLRTFTNQPYRQKIDEYIYDIESLKYVEATTPTSDDPNDRTFDSVINQEKYKLIWPIKDREIIVCSSCVYDLVSNLYVIGFKSCDSVSPSKPTTEGKKKERKVIRACVVGGWFFESVNDGKHTKFHEIYYIDMKGSIPKLMMDLVITNRAEKFYKHGMKCMAENEKNGFPKPVKDVFLYRLFEKNGSVHLR